MSLDFCSSSIYTKDWMNLARFWLGAHWGKLNILAFSGEASASLTLALHFP